MAKKKYEFRPDKQGSGFLSKLYLTRRQRLSLLRWTLYALTLLILSVVQDVVLCKVDILGATTELVPCAVLLICVYLGTESGSVFCLIAAAAYGFSGTAPGYYDIVLITALGVGAAMFRQSYLRKSASSDMLCAGVAFLLYKLSHYAIGLVFEMVPFGRIGVFLLGAVLSGLLIPALYPIITVIDRIGGETWKE